ncbi:protein phosphatase methylesterase [Ramicandelaber brevisporus]|nr:protein phosphatase methylesterase [Ramicandelaber brevisporus]
MSKRIVQLRGGLPPPSASPNAGAGLGAGVSAGSHLPTPISASTSTPLSALAARAHRELNMAMSSLDEFDEEDEDADIDSAYSSRAASTRSLRYQPADWTSYFDERREIVLDNGWKHVVYLSAGCSPTAPVIVFHHGAGLSALSFSLVARNIRNNSEQSLAVLAFDARGHGHTVPADENSASDANDPDLSLPALATDTAKILEAVFPNHSEVILAGHSMGAAVMTECVSGKYVQKVAGLAIIDIAEGNQQAIDMTRSFILRRPTAFTSVHSAIEWHISSRIIRTKESARISVPPIVAPHEQPSLDAVSWRTDLLATEKYWASWFTDLDAKFLTCKCAKLLMISSTDVITKVLMIGQMQGKFQTEPFTGCGHLLHEDDPTRAADLLLRFWQHTRPVIVTKNLPGQPAQVIQPPSPISPSKSLSPPNAQ